MKRILLSLVVSITVTTVIIGVIKLLDMTMRYLVTLSASTATIIGVCFIVCVLTILFRLAVFKEKL